MIMVSKRFLEHWILAYGVVLQSDGNTDLAHMYYV